MELLFRKTFNPACNASNTFLALGRFGPFIGKNRLHPSHVFDHFRQLLVIGENPDLGHEQFRIRVHLHPHHLLEKGGRLRR